MENKFDYAKNPVSSIYGEYCFTDLEMKKRLPKEIYKSIKKVQSGACELTIEVANVVANAIKDWAIEKGATHYTHWFQPLTGATAEKHDSFISPCSDGSVIMEFSGKELIQGEPDASSFPSGGLRATFEARGYTAWDTTSPAFLKKDATGLTLAIPTAFISYTGEALDKKTPLLRSMEALSKQAVRLLKILGNDSVEKVVSTVGPEQEYFLIQKELYDARPDLKLAGRTVFGSMSSKGQELEDHYFGAIKDRVANYMRELNHELWKMGVSAKTQHNEVAPNQFELAAIFNTSNVSVDSNQLVMETMKKVAARHDLVCLLHEKPFAGVNGNGKHNNWSMSFGSTNLLEPGKTPHQDAQFLLCLVAVIKAIDVYAPILRASAANPGNDHRLGANEAPPAIISIFLGDQLTEILDKLSSGKPVESKEGIKMELGVTALPKFPKDLTDRNRTSPFAFTGNKFEFRMVGSSQSLAGPNVVLNTVVAEILGEFADKLSGSKNLNADISKLVIDTYNAHKRVVFNGNGYSEEWQKEAEKRGLKNLKSAVYAIPEFSEDYSVKLFSKHGVLSKEELHSRVDIYLENYSKTINIEAGCMIEMANRMIIPAATDYLTRLCDSVSAVKDVVPSADTSAQEEIITKVSSALGSLRKETLKLASVLASTQEIKDVHEQAVAFREKVCEQMAMVRKFGDEIETLCDRESWPYPSYEELLFNL